MGHPHDRVNRVAHHPPMPSSYDEIFPNCLGRLMSNLIQLEFAIRVALHCQEPDGERLSTEVLRFARPGDELPENFLTDWRSLGGLIEEYNERETHRGAKLISDEIVDLRDALAHGRMSASTLTSEYRLIRFAKPDSKRRIVKIESVAVLTLEWFEQQICRTADATEVVYARILELKPDARRR